MKTGKQESRKTGHVLDRRLMWATCIFCFPAFLLSCFAAAVKAVDAADLAAVRAVEQQRIDTINKVYGSVVAVYGKTRQGGGSGVIYDPEGYALTNYHVVKSTGDTGLAGLADGVLYPFKVIGIDPGGDVAIIKLKHPQGKPFPYARLGDDDTVRVGDFVMAMGNPFVLAEDYTPTVTLGVVSGVKRYQPGQGGTNVLEYGDCIQIDSSINPGNSGGPLFNMQGEVVGINGRGSFEERGRVNVGVGYAIGINQIKRFIPDMLATKIAMHATLNATFGTRAGKVTCDQIDLESKAYEKGLRLGDRLLRFDGRDITNANQFKNHLTTLPAGWPVELVWERDGKEHTAWLRLDAAPYPKAPKRPQPKAKPQPKDDEDKGGNDEEDESDKPADSSKPVPPPALEPGKIRDAKQNRVEVARILKDWRAFAGVQEPRQGMKAIRYRIDAYSTDEDKRKLVKRDEVIEAMDGRFMMKTFIPRLNRTTREWWDGKQYWTAQDDAVPEVSDEHVTTRWHRLAWHHVYMSLQATDAANRFKDVELQGSDMVSGQPAYRVRVVDEHDNGWRLWFSVLHENGQDLQVRLIKVGANDINDSGIVLADYRPVGGVMVPHRTYAVPDEFGANVFGETVVEADPLWEINDAMFRPPSDKP